MQYFVSCGIEEVVIVWRESKRKGTKQVID
jgi:hypothetical protein